MLRRGVLALCVWLGLVTAALAEKRVALVLAVDDYQFIRPLENPSNDARAMEDLLESLDFEVFVETNRDLRRMRRALEDFQTDAAGADVALLFFAGHGVAIEGVNYLLPTDADASSSAKLAETALPLAEAQAVMRSVAPAVIVLLDACRDDPFSGGGKDGRGAAPLSDDPPEAPKPTPGLGRMGSAEGVVFAFATAPNETASDGTGQNSPFTEALVRHFATAGVEVRSALTLVQQDVYDRSRGKQLPYIESGLPGQVFLTGQGAQSERDQLLMAMANLTPDLRAEVEAMATERNMPLAPLYAAVLSADLASQAPEERARLLQEAANSYESFQAGLLGLQSDDPRVADLRERAQESFALGAFDTGRALLNEAAEIDAASRVNFREGNIKRTVSEAATRLLSASAAQAELRYDLAIEDLNKAVALYADIADEDLDRDTRLSYATALLDLGTLQMVAGNTRAALDAHYERSRYAQLQVEADPTDMVWVRELIWSLNSVGDVLTQQGYLNEAEKAFASALEFVQWQSGQVPDDPDLLRDRQVTLIKQGEIRLARSDFDGALTAFREAEAITNTLLASDPESPVLRQDQSIALERIGDVLVAKGDAAGAEAAFRQSLAVTEALAAEFPDNTGVRLNLSVSYERIGDREIDAGDLETALETYGKALVIREEIAALDPGNMVYRRGLAVTFERIGDINRLRGDPESALLAHQAAADIREGLAALDPTNMLWQADLALSLERLGDLYYAQNDLAAALAAHEKCRGLREGIVALDPQNLPRQRDLGVAMERVADVKLAMGDRATAMALHQDLLLLRQALVAANPSIGQYRRDTTISLAKLAELHVEDGNLAAADPLFAEAVKLHREIVSGAPEQVLALRELTIAEMRHAANLLALGDATAALRVSQEGLSTVDRLLQLAPEVPDHTHDLLVVLNRLGDAQVAVGDHASAVASFRQMVAAGNALLDVDPYSTAWANDLSLGLVRLGIAQAETGDLAGALKSHQDGLALREWLVQQDSSNVDWYRNLAISHEHVGTMLSAQGDMQAALEQQDRSLQMMRDLSAVYPDDPWYKLDVVRALDLKAVLLQDGTAENQEALAILEDMAATGTLPQGYEDWIPAFRRTLGLPTDF